MNQLNPNYLNQIIKEGKFPEEGGNPKYLAIGGYPILCFDMMIQKKTNSINLNGF
jgi:hypothetical protein